MDLVMQPFRADASRRFWVVDVTYVRMRQGFAHVAFVTDVFSRRIVGDPYGNAMAEAIDALCKTELIRGRGPWRSVEEVELATLEWVKRFNNRRLHSELDYRTAHDAENDCYADTESFVKAIASQTKPENETQGDSLRAPSPGAYGWAQSSPISSQDNRLAAVGRSGVSGCGAERRASDLQFVGRDGVASGMGVACDLRSRVSEFSHEPVDACGGSHCVAVTVQ